MKIINHWRKLKKTLEDGKISYAPMIGRINIVTMVIVTKQSPSKF
jgi:hypothetical protein